MVGDAGETCAQYGLGGLPKLARQERLVAGTCKADLEAANSRKQPDDLHHGPVHARTGITRVDERANAYMSHVRRSPIHYMSIKASCKEHCVNINASPRSGSTIPDPLRVSGFGLLLTPRRENHHDGMREGVLVGERQLDGGRKAGGRQRGEAAGGAAGEPEEGFARGEIVDLDVAPADALAEAGAQRLGTRLLGGVALGVAGGAVDVAVAAAALEVGVHTPAESIAPALQRTPQAADVDQVGADAQDHPPGLADTARSDRRHAPGFVHQHPHPRDALFQSEKDRLADQEVADVELDDLRNGGDRTDIVVAEAVAGVTLDPE